ncbi:MAG: class I SAM-dependent RNA methyltransferase [Smithellaceae bacterium]|jgi:putative N6-adenine-specific DNA methylase|nr:class I SAM-dependent RNA methyltransferase [Smithellaceae bacterium]MDD3259883.1 class I SAM-dependent RNA methyltransferase [Smithellaceae bacterium]MDD3849654.1 class I SAM-dependent RNA methyltransferase [Smithellaceae bacterium]HOG12679.1 class I SAM-dependent RNA methyltransferase [Smithellaceae bacterium]HPL10341.1 class I SAM-dependent RNA methyltransferase [Smithellaceae bacterium]
MSIWQKKSRILITCPKGVVPYLKAEIEALGFPVVQEIDTAVSTEGTLADTMSLNLHLRTAQHVLYQLQIFKALSPGALYERLNAIPWETILHDSGPSAYVCVTSVADHPDVTDSRYVNLRAKDAIVDRIREKTGIRPDSGPERNRAVIHVYWRNDQAMAYIDTSGERLSLRGYRKIPLAAPMQETLAAALIMATQWRGRTPLVNPMCGSGTLAIEAALIALHRAAGLGRSNYGFLHIRDFPREAWQALRKDARDASLKALPSTIIASDIDPRAVEAARRNAQTAGVDRLIEFRVCPFEKTPTPGGKGVIVMNPPYGERLEPFKIKTSHPEHRKEIAPGQKVIVRKAADIVHRSGGSTTLQRLEALYEGCGDWFKSIGRGYLGYIFTGNLEMAKKVGLRTRRRMTFYNGEIECRLLEYELYAGSKKHKAAPARPDDADTGAQHGSG